MRSDVDILLEFAVTGLADHDAARRFTETGGLLGRDRIEVARAPGGNDIGDIAGITLVRQQMIGAR